MKISRFGFTRLVIVLLFMVMFPSSAYAGDDPEPIQFDSQEMLSTTWPEAIETLIINNSSNDLILSVSLAGFDFRWETQLIEIYQVLEWPRKIGLLSIERPSLSEDIIDVRFRENVELDPGIYTGHIVVSEPTTETTIRRAVQITVEKEPNAIVPSVVEWTVIAYRIPGESKLTCVESCYLPFDKQIEKVNSKEFVLFGSNGGAISLTFDEDISESAKTAGFSLEFLGENALVGEYKDNLEFNPKDIDSEVEDNPVSVTVKVNDHWLIAVSWIVAGIGLALGIQKWNGVSRRVSALTTRLDVIEVVEKNNGGKVRGRNINVKYYSNDSDGISIASDMKKQIDDVINTLEEVSGSFVSVDEKSNTKFQDAEKVVEKIVTAHKTWEDFKEAGEDGKPIETKINTLKLGLDKFKREIQQQYPHPHKKVLSKKDNYEGKIIVPTFYLKAKELLVTNSNDPQLTLDNFQDLAQKINGALSLLEESSWTSSHRIAIWVIDNLKIIERIAPPATKMSEKERDLFIEAKLQANSGWVDLWVAPDSEDLALKKSQLELIFAQDAVWRLSHYFGGDDGLIAPREPVSIVNLSKSWGAEIYTVFDRFEKFGQRLIPSRELKSSYLKLIERESSLNLAEVTRSAAKRLRTGDSLVIVVAVLIAVSTGLSQLYVDKSFGAWPSYMAALTWGTATELVLDGIDSALKNYFGGAKAANFKKEDDS